MIFVISAAIAVFLAGAVTGIITVIIAGIHRDDRAKNLTNVPRSRAEAATRRAIGVGVRNDNTQHGRSDR